MSISAKVDWIILDGTALRTWIAVVIVVVWSMSAVVAFFSGNFEELGIITPVMMIVTGFLFGFRHEYIIRDDKNPSIAHDDPNE